jgi:probable HAF family extracellular repeat protein
MTFYSRGVDHDVAIPGPALGPHRLTACDHPTEPAVSAPIAAPARSSAVAQQFHVRILPRGFSLPFAINERAEVVGTKDFPDGTVHAAVWRAGHGVKDLGTLGGDGSQAMDINDRGDVVGHSSIPNSFDIRPFIWTNGSGMRSFGNFQSFSGATGINNRREVVGGSLQADGTFQAFLWRPGRGTRILGTLGGANSFAEDVNDATQVVGSSQLSDGTEHAFLWTSERGMEDLGTLGGANSIAWDISPTGAVVGASETADGRRVGYV